MPLDERPRGPPPFPETLAGHGTRCAKGRKARSCRLHGETPAPLAGRHPCVSNVRVENSCEQGYSPLEAERIDEQHEGKVWACEKPHRKSRSGEGSRHTLGVKQVRSSSLFSHSISVRTCYATKMSKLCLRNVCVQCICVVSRCDVSWFSYRQSLPSSLSHFPLRHFPSSPWPLTLPYPRTPPLSKPPPSRSPPPLQPHPARKPHSPQTAPPTPNFSP